MGVDVDEWVHRLKAGYDAGYYKTEPEEEAQSSFPWQNKTCQNCPFWSNSICAVYSEYRSSTAHTCVYFDPWNREAAQSIVQERQTEGFRRWWQWFNERGEAR